MNSNEARPHEEPVKLKRIEAAPSASSAAYWVQVVKKLQADLETSAPERAATSAPGPDVTVSSAANRRQGQHER
jgi:hypothetical protein